MAATPAASQLIGVLRQNATLALAALPNGMTSSGSAPIRKMACTLFSRPSTHNAAAAAIASGRAIAGAASGHDQDHEREDDGTRGDQLAAQDSRMHGDAAGERECKGREHRDAPVAHDETNKAMRKPARNRSRSERPEGVRRERRWSWRHRMPVHRRPAEWPIATMRQAGRTRAAADTRAFTDRMVM